MKEINLYQLNEKHGRILFEELIKDRITGKETTGEFDRIDYVLDNKEVCEIKVRDKKYKDYPTLMMEVNKYKSLLDYYKQGRDGWYVNFLGEDECYIFKTSKIRDMIYKRELKPEYIRCNRTTSEDTGKAAKKVLMLDKLSADRYVKENGVWKQKINLL